MTKTFKEIVDFNRYAANFLRRNDNTKAGYAIKRLLEKQFSSHFDDYNQELEFKRIDLALTDKETGAILTNKVSGGRNYQYTPVSLKKLIQEEDAILKKWNLKNIEFESWFVTELPKDITDQEKEAFKDFIIKTDTHHDDNITNDAGNKEMVAI